MKVLVTGGAGFVGTNLIKRLLKEGHEVQSLDNYSTGLKSNEVDGCRYWTGDIQNICTDAFKYAASPDFIAQKGFNALMNGKKVVIPEVLFRFLIGISRLIPLSLKLRLIEKMQTK